MNIINSSDAESNDWGNEIESVIGDSSEINTLGSIDTIDDHRENDSVSNTDNVADSPPVLTRPHRNTRLPDCYQDFNPLSVWNGFL